MSEWISVDDHLPGYPWRGLVYVEGHKEHSGASWFRNGIGIAVHWTPGEQHADENGWPDWALRKLSEEFDMDEITMKLWANTPPLPDGTIE